MSKKVSINGLALTLVAKPRKGSPNSAAGKLVLELENWSVIPAPASVVKHNSSDPNVASSSFSKGVSAPIAIHVGRRPSLKISKPNVVSKDIGEWTAIATGGCTLDAEVEVNPSATKVTVNPSDDVKVK
jgi:hypothetical protein